MQFDVFNGDADGICALVQLRLHTPCPDARRITGVKRDILLLADLEETAGASWTVLDISFDRNRSSVEQLLTKGNTIVYIDHHYPGLLPSLPNLTTHIDLSPCICTSLIVDRLLGGLWRPWAIVGAFGDNLDEAALGAAERLQLEKSQIDALRETGVLLNYNGYGATVADLLVHPDVLFQEALAFRDPYTFHEYSVALKRIRTGYAADMAMVADLAPIRSMPSGRIFHLPDAAWARRVTGSIANRLARQQPQQASAILVPNPDGSLMVSVRAPIDRPQGADSLCRQFDTGGGRPAAAGINMLPHHQVNAFYERFFQHFS